MVFDNLIKNRYLEMLLFMLMAMTFIAPVANMIQSSTGVIDLFRYDAPKGQLFYIFSKIFAICSFILLFWQLLLGLLKMTGRRLHIILGSLLFSLILLHVIAFVLAVSLRGGSFAFHILLPDFFSGYYKSAVSLGVVALLLLFISIYSGALRSKVSRHWLRGHHLVFITYMLVVAHAFMIGSEVQSDVFESVLFFSVFIIALIPIIKLLRSYRVS